MLEERSRSAREGKRERNGMLEERPRSTHPYNSIDVYLSQYV